MSKVLLAPKAPISKADAALRQLHRAIDLFFSEDDPVVVHTLASAAGVILYDIAGHRNAFRLIDLIRRERLGEFLKAVREPQNFFKHADKDPDAILAFDPSGTHFVIMDAVMTCESLQIPLSHERQMFYVWFALQYPDVFDWNAVPPWLFQLRNRIAGYSDPLDPLRLKFFSEVLSRRRGNCADVVERQGGRKTRGFTANNGE